MSKVLSILGNIWLNYLRYRWSEFRHRDSPKCLDRLFYQYLIPSSLDQITSLSKKLFNRFEYTQDNLTMLFDSMDSPASCWLSAFEHPPLRDDCDGFHSALYWASSIYFYCRLLTIMTIPLAKSHTCLIIKEGPGVYWIVDYTRTKGPFSSVGEAVKSIYKEGSVKVITYSLSFWNGSRWSSKNF